MRGDSEWSHPANQVGDAEGKKAPGETGDKPQEGKKSMRARFRRRISLPRPRVSKPKLPKPKLSRPEMPPPKMPEGADDLWFRIVPRLRAIGYWLKEKWQLVWRWIKQVAAAVAYWWSKRSRAARIRIFAVAGVVVLYLILKFLPVPGVPCGISAAKECAPSNDTIAYVPRDAELYVHLTVNSDSHQWDLAGDLRGELPNFAALLQSDTSAFATSAGPQVDVTGEILPWAKNDLALLGVPAPKGKIAEAYVVGVGDSHKADQFLAGLSTPKSKQAKVGDATLRVYSSGVATARSGDQALFGNVLGVRAALAAKRGTAPGLEGTDQDAARADLPDVRLAEIYLSRTGVR